MPTKSRLSIFSKEIKQSVGFKKLYKAVKHDEKTSPNFHNYFAKLDWVINQATHYAEKTEMNAVDILNSWEKQRSYWYMNFYQEANQPTIKDDSIKVFDTVEELLESIGKEGFRCPSCKGVSKDAYTCDTGLEMSKGKICDWKSFGLFGTMGLGVSVFVKKELRIDSFFMPLAWEKK